MDATSNRRRCVSRIDGCYSNHGISDTQQHLKLLIARPGMIGKIGEPLYPVSPAVSSITRCIQYHPLYPVSPAVSSITRCIQYHPLYPVSSPVLSITGCTHAPKIPNCWIMKLGIRNTGNTGLVITHRVGMRHYKMNDEKLKSGPKNGTRGTENPINWEIRDP
jgi:hypothetical protein